MNSFFPYSCTQPGSVTSGVSSRAARPTHSSLPGLTPLTNTEGRPRPPQAQHSPLTALPSTQPLPSPQQTRGTEFWTKLQALDGHGRVVWIFRSQLLLLEKDSFSSSHSKKKNWATDSAHMGVLSHKSEEETPIQALAL